MLHVYPIKEEKDHNFDDSTCSCGTRMILSNEGEMIIVHNLIHTKNKDKISDDEIRRYIRSTHNC